MARIIILTGKHDAEVRLKGTVLERAFSDESVDFVANQVRSALDLANRVYVAKKVSEVRSRHPEPGSNAAKVEGCTCLRRRVGGRLTYSIDENCRVHKGNWPKF